MANFNFKDGVIREGNTGIGNGNILGNIKDGVIRKGNYAGTGAGTILGNVKNGIIREGSNAGAGVGKILGNVKDGTIREGNNAESGVGNIIGRSRDFMIKGMEREDEAEIVAAYHFLGKKIFSGTGNNQVGNQQRASSTKVKTTRTSNTMDNVSDGKQLGELIFNKIFSLLESFFGKTGARIIVFAIILYIFRDFFIALFTTAEPPPIRCFGLCENQPKPPL